MNSTDFTLNIIAALNKQLSKKQLKNDLKSMDNSMSVKVLAKLTTALSKKQLASSLKQINNLYVQVGTKLKTDNSTKKNIMSEIGQLQKNLSELQMKVGIDKAASANTIKSIVSTAKTAQQYADKTSITLNLEAHKEKAVNDILYIGQKYSKLFSNISASKKYENLLNSAYSISDKSQLQEVRAQISAFTSELKVHGLAVESTGDKWRKLIDRAKDLFSAATLIKVAFTQVKQAISTTLDLDKVYTDLVKVNSALERKDYAEYLSKINQKAKELATTQKGLIEGATEFSKSGFDLSTSNKLSEKSTILANVGEMSDSDSAKAIISGVQAYDIVDGFTDVVDKADALISKYNEIGNTASITTAEIAQGVQKVGSVFADANTSVDEFIALLSAGNRQFQDADSLALGLRTAALRIRGCSAELAAMGEETDTVVTSTAKLEEQIKALTNINGAGGVDILEADGETFRSIYDIFLDISKVYKDMSDTDASALLELIAGKNRASAISATLNNMSEAEENLQNSINAAGSAQKEYNAYIESTEAHIAKFQATLVETYSTFMNGDMISHAADMGTAILNLVNQTDLLKHSILSILALNIGKGITTVGAAIVSTSQQMNTLGNALQQVKNLPMDDVLREKELYSIGDATRSLTEKNLKLLLSQKQLNEDDKIAILIKHNLTEEEAQLKLEKMGLITATKTQSALNVTEATTTFTLKNAMTSLKASIVGVGTSIKAAFLNNPIGITLMAATTIISVATTAINKHNQKLEEARLKVKELGDSFKTTKSDIESYKSQIEELYKTINDSNSSIEDVTNARQTLMSVQNELIDKFGTEESVIKDVTDAINDQTEALDRLTQTKWQETKNEFNNGKDNIQRMLDEYGETTIGFQWVNYADVNALTDEMVAKLENIGIDIKVNTENLQGIRDFDSLTESIADTTGAFLTISGNAEEIYNKLLALQKLAGDNSLDRLYDSIESKANSYKDLTETYKDFYNQYILYEKILTEDSNYADKFKDITEAYEEYKDVFTSGNEGKIKETADEYAEIVATAMSTAIANGDTDVATYFENMYPTLKSTVESWKFNVAFDANTENLQSEIQSVLDELKDVDGRQLTIEEILGLGEANEQYQNLVSIAHSYNMSIEEMIELLKERNLVSAMDYQGLVGLFGQESIDKLSAEELEIAYQIKNVGNITFEELQTERGCN